MQTLTEPRVHLWTRDEYYKLGEVGLFEDRHIELIEGQIIELSPQGSVHSIAIIRVSKVLEAVFGSAYYARGQMPLNLGALSAPEPDVAIIEGPWEEDESAHPTTAVLVIEVADTSLTYDRITKASLYAKAGIAEYWIVNVVDRQLEVYRQPGADPNARYEFGYGETHILTPGDTVAPLARPEARIAVADLLPRDRHPEH